MTHFGAESGLESDNPLGYDPAVDGIFPDDDDPAVASTEEEARYWSELAESEGETYEPPSYAD